MLVDVVGLVRRREHLALVDEIDTDGLEDLSLDEVADAGLADGRQCGRSGLTTHVAPKLGRQRAVRGCTLAITGMVTAALMRRIMPGSLMRATPPSLRMSAGTRSRAMTASSRKFTRAHASAHFVLFY